MDLYFYAIPFEIYDVMYDITTIPKGTLFKTNLQFFAYHVTDAEMFYEITISLINSLIL